MLGRQDVATHFTIPKCQILQLVAGGLTDKEVAARLGISKNTVATHMSRLFARSGTRSRSAAAGAWLAAQVTTTADPLAILGTGGDPVRALIWA